MYEFQQRHTHTHACAHTHIYTHTHTHGGRGIYVLYIGFFWTTENYCWM